MYVYVSVNAKRADHASMFVSFLINLLFVPAIMFVHAKSLVFVRVDGKLKDISQQCILPNNRGMIIGGVRRRCCCCWCLLVVAFALVAATLSAIDVVASSFGD